VSKHIVNRFDFDVIIAGFLRIVDEPGLYSKYKKMLESRLFFYNDISPRPRAFRKLIDWFLAMMETGKVKETDVSLTAFGDYISSYPPESDQNKEAIDLFRSYSTNPDIIHRMKDKGSFDLFRDYLRLIRFIKYSNEMFSEYQEGNTDKAASLMQKTLEDLALLKDGIEIEYNVEKDFDNIIFQRRAADNVKTLYSGNVPLDNVIGGFEQSTLNLFISVTNGGKSMMGHHLVSQAIKQKMRVHLSCVEDRKESWFRKIAANLSGIPISVLKEFTDPRMNRTPTTQEKASLLEAKELIKKYVHVDFIYGQSVEAIHKRKREYDLECIANEWTIPVVDIVDYTGHIATRSSGDKMYEQLRNAYGQRKDYALSSGKICFDFAQVNRAGAKAVTDSGQRLNTADLAGSYDLAQVCDNIISINRGDLEFETSTCVLKVAKARDGKVGDEFQVKIDFSCARFLMDHPQTIWLTGNQKDMESVRAVDASKVG
jgi:hypothetical protein